MNSLFKKPQNMEYSEIEFTLENDLNSLGEYTLFKYLYLISKQFLKKRVSLNSSETEQASIQLATIVFEKVREFKKFESTYLEDLYYDVIINVSRNNKYLERELSENCSLSNHLMDLMKPRYVSFNDILDISNEVDKLSRWFPYRSDINLKVSILLTVRDTLKKHYEKVLANKNYNIEVKLYRVPNIYIELIKSAVRIVLTELADSFDVVTCSKRPNINSLRLWGLMENEG